MSSVGKKLVGVLKERGLEELDVSNALIALTIDIIGTVGFHHEFNTVDTINVMSMSPMLQVLTSTSSHIYLCMHYHLPHFVGTVPQIFVQLD